jgi:aminoglycoside phosphotransferase (APT) family kinase protein
MRRKQGSRRSDDEPEPDPKDWAEFGGELYFAVDETAGGAPIGLTFDEYRAAQMEEPHAPGWARALRLLQRATARADGTHRDIGRVTRIGDGLSRDVYGAAVDFGGKDVNCAVLLPRRRADAGLCERTHREARLLEVLARADLPLRLPRVLAVLPTPTGPALVREHLRGVSVDLRVGRMPGIRPWQLVAEVAAAVHAVDTAELGWFGPATRRAHALAGLAGLGAPAPDDDAVVQEAFAWLRQHLPPDEPAVLVHGDLLGQNIILWPDEPLGLIDWEYATLGDPAYDLAIVTRGARKPFQTAGGFEKLLESYNAEAQRPVHAREVRFHELCLAMRWYRDEPQATVRQGYLHQIANLLAWAQRD